jgi:hypothetical protein
MTTKAFIGFIFILIFAACDDSHQQDKPDPETPKALQDKSVSSEILSKRGSGDLVENLYSELLDKDPRLKNLEDKIQELSESKDDSTRLFDEYNSKNQNYYSSANGHADQLSDSLLKEKIKMLISNSLANYNSSIAKHNALLMRIDSQNTTLSDLHIILKIAKTLPLIENYQEVNLPSTKPIEGFIQKQTRAIKLGDTLSKK